MTDPLTEPTPPEPASAPRLPFARIGDIQRLPEGERWLVDGFLTGSSITVLASSPKWQRQHEKGPRGSLKRDPLPDAA